MVKLLCCNASLFKNFMREAFDVAGRISSSAVETVKQANISNIFRPKMLALYLACIGVGACSTNDYRDNLKQAYNDSEFDEEIEAFSDVPLTAFQIDEDEVVTLQGLAEMFGKGEGFKKRALEYNPECCKNPVILPVPYDMVDSYSNSVGWEKFGRGVGDFILMDGIPTVLLGPGAPFAHRALKEGVSFGGKKLAGFDTIEETGMYLASKAEHLQKSKKGYVFPDIRTLRYRVNALLEKNKLGYGDVFYLKGEVNLVDSSSRK